MALIKCSECGREVSDKAMVCPACGNPISSVSTDVPVVEKIEIEMTNKKWKKRGLWALAIFILGWILMSQSVSLGFFIVFISFCVGLSARIGAWWTNG